MTPTKTETSTIELTLEELDIAATSVYRRMTDLQEMARNLRNGHLQEVYRGLAPDLANEADRDVWAHQQLHERLMEKIREMQGEE
jgi:hypothetical protein